MKKYLYIVRTNSELIFWVTALGLLYFADTGRPGEHFTLCLFRLAGIHFCPGCGIGHSIHALMHGDLQESVQYHWFGIPALLIILTRVISLIKKIKYVKPPKPAYEYS